jgi:hypothetical protein
MAPVIMIMASGSSTGTALTKGTARSCPKSEVRSPKSEVRSQNVEPRLANQQHSGAERGEQHQLAAQPDQDSGGVMKATSRTSKPIRVAGQLCAV